MKLGLAGVGRIGALHAENLAALRGQPEAHGSRISLLVTDLDADRGRRAARAVDAGFASSAAEMLDRGIDGLVVAAGTSTHPELIRAGVAAGVPVFCEKPVAADVAAALPVLDAVREHRGIVQIGHQRRFDAGYREAKRRLDAGELGWIHSFHAVTGDMFPPSVDFLATSGGLFRDCSVHDFDILRWLTGQEIVEVFASGSNRGDPDIGRVGDIDTGLALVTLGDGTVGTVSATRYNGAGHDVRLELRGSRSTAMVGWDGRAAVQSAEPGMTASTVPPYRTFAERFAAAYRAEMLAFIEVVQGRRGSPCTPEDSVAASKAADAAQLSLATGLPVKVER